MARFNKNKTTSVTRLLKTPGAELCYNACGVVNEQKIFCPNQCSSEGSMNKFRAYVHRQAFRSSQDLSVWLALTTRQQLMSHDCSKQQALSFAKMLVVWRIFSSDQCSQEYSLNKFRAYIHRHVFRPSQNSSVCLRLTSRGQPISPECSKHQVLSFAKMLVVL